MKDLESAEYKEKSNFKFFRLLFFELWRKNNVAGNSGMQLRAILLKLGSSIVPRTKRATNRNNVATEKRSKFFFHKHFSNIFKISIFIFHGRSEIGWIERKTKFQIFAIFIFRVMVILVKKSPLFSTITRKIRIGEFSNYFSRSIYSAQTAPFITTFEGGGSACPRAGHSRNTLKSI